MKMDYANRGTENQAHVQVSPKPRPPAVPKKPKPALPRKPTYEVKQPEKCEPVSYGKQNGNGPAELETSETSLPASQTPEPRLPSDTSTPCVFPPAKDPPPPLPKTPPKGQPFARTPPPLPKAPPAGKASVKPKPLQPPPKPAQRLYKVTDNESIESHSVSTKDSGACGKVSESVIESDAHNKAFDAVADQTLKDKEYNEKKNASSKISKFYTTSEIEEPPKPAPSPKVSPRVPLKPKVRVDKNTSPSPDEASFKSGSVPSDTEQRVTSSGRSTWYISNDSSSQDSNNPDSSNGSNESLQQSTELQIKLKNGNGFESSSVKFRKKQSPVVPRKPLPKIPLKRNQNIPEGGVSKVNDVNKSVDSSRCDRELNDNSINVKNDEVSSSESNTFHETLESDVKQEESSRQKVPSAKPRNIESPHSDESPEVFSHEKVPPETHPKPTPRKHVPTARPRPTPRKRLSLNRLSDTEESLISQLKSSDILLSDSDQGDKIVLPKAKSEENVSRSSHGFDFVTDSIDINDSKIQKSSPDSVGSDVANSDNSSQDQNDTSSPCLKVNSLVKSRVVYSEVGEEKQYRVIDKSIIKTQKHVVELDDDYDDNDAEVVVLRSKDSAAGETEQICERQALTEGESKSDSTKSSSPEHAQSDVSSTSSVHNSSTLLDNGILVTNKDTVGDVDSYNDICDKNEVKKPVDVSPGSKDSFDDLLTDTALLEPTSLLNEIEEILSRSYKHSSLSRSGSSPEKKSSPMLPRVLNIKYERSRSCDNEDTSPVRPPRPKKELKKLRSRSQMSYDSCGSDTESLPDTSKFTEEQFAAVKANKAHTLGPAKPHPPKPKRNKLMKVQRSQSDVTAMKAFLDSQESKDHLNHKRQVSDAGPSTMQRNSCDLSGVTTEDGKSGERPKSWRTQRPSRRAPAPPAIPPFRITPPSPSVDINTVVPVNVRAKSLNLDDRKKASNSEDIHTEKVDKSKKALQDSAGSLYQSINDIEDYSDDDHDYHEIPEVEKADSGCASNESSMNVSGMVKPNNGIGKGKLRSPPKLPPRNLNNSQSFETSSLSSTGHDFDSALTGCASSLEDVSISSCKAYPKTSSPNVTRNGKSNVADSSGARPDSLSLSESSDGQKKRPVSGISTQSDSGSGSHVTGHMSSSESDEEDDEKMTRKKEKKLFMIAQEVASSERVFVDVLVLLNVDFRKHIAMTTEENGRPVIPADMLNRILDYLPQLQNFNEDLLKDLDDRISKWDKHPGIADIFVKKGPFLKLYSSYIRDFETMNSALDEAVKKYPAFATALKEFEKSPRCACLALKHYMLKPIQRIPQYRLLLTDYMKHLLPDTSEMKDAQTALVIVSEVAHHANENMRHGDYVQKMLEIQRSLIGQFEVIVPGRIFLKEGELMKLSRKEMQPRFFFLFNDVLLYTIPVATGYRLKYDLPLAGMRIKETAQDDYKLEFSIITEKRSFTLHGTTLEERDDWVTALNSAIQENLQKRGTFEAVRAGAPSDWDTYQGMIDKDFVLGDKPPLWIPDARVSMCMLCTCEFTLTWRRHHCRACGRIVCGNCSENEAPLRYLKYKQKRVCDECYKCLVKENVDGAVERERGNSSAKEEEESSFLGGLFERFVKPRRSGRTEKKSFFNFRPDRLIAVHADDEGACISGYLHRLDGKKWKKMWYIVKDNVLYWFKASKDRAAENSMALLGYEVSRFNDYFEGVEANLLFQLSHQNVDPVVFKTDSAATTERWVTVMRESSLV